MPEAPAPAAAPDGPTAEVPEAPPPAAPAGFGESSFVEPEPEAWGTPGDEKISRGNRGIFIAFLIALILGAAVAVLWYLDKRDYNKWHEELTTALRLPDGEFEVAMRNILERCDHKEILVQAALELGEAQDAEAVPLLTKTLALGGIVGREAAKALAKIDGEAAKSSLEEIHKQMVTAVELDKAVYAWALCTLGDSRGFGPLLEAVGKRIITPKSLPEFDPDVIIRVGTTPKLIEQIDSPDPMLRMYAAMELGFRTDADVVPALLKLVKDAQDDVAEAAAISLGRTADERAGPALLETMRTKPQLRSSILGAITQSVGSPGLETIYSNTKKPSIKYKIVGKLKQLRDPRSTDLLLAIADEEFPGSEDKEKLEADEIRNQALWTLESLGDKRIGDRMFAKTQWEPVSPELIPDSAIRYRQDDMSRKIANGVVTWFGKVRPEGTADYLMKIYEANQPFANTPESAQRVKVDIGPLMDSMGRTADQRFCDVIFSFLDKDEGFFFQSASISYSRLSCPKAAEEFMGRMAMTKEEREEEKFSTLIESRDWQMENRLQERRNSIIATRFLGDPKVAEILMSIVTDPTDDPELRKEAATSLAYVADEETMNQIVAQVNDEAIDIVARAALIQGLWHNPSDAAVEGMFKILEGELNYQLVKPAGIVIGEAGNPAFDARLNALLDHKDEHRARVAALAIMLGGNLERLDKVIKILQDQEARLLVRDWYQSHPIFLDKKMFESNRVFKRLIIATEISDRTETSGDPIIWPWKYLMDRLKNGWADGPNGLASIEIRELLTNTVRESKEYGPLAAYVLSGLGERGYLLALQSEQGPQSLIARDTLRSLVGKSQ